jgi:ssRNA-specific RNase YbeY (16S rRNA maturation enzyme)
MATIRTSGLETEEVINVNKMFEQGVFDLRKLSQKTNNLIMKYMISLKFLSQKKYETLSKRERKQGKNNEVMSLMAEEVLPFFPIGCLFFLNNHLFFLSIS